MEGGLGRRPCAQSVHAPPAVVHRCDCCQANHVPHAAVAGGWRPGKPDAGLGQRRCEGLLSGGGGGDGGDDSSGNGAGPEVVVAVGSGLGATEAGLLEVQPGGGGEGIVDQPPEGLLALVLPADAPQALQQVQQLIHWACSCIKGQGGIRGKAGFPAALLNWGNQKVCASTHSKCGQKQRAPLPQPAQPRQHSIQRNG